MANSKIFGEIYANIYDVIYGNKNYVKECDVVEQVFKKKKTVHSILDLGCGTGGHAAELSKRCYKIVGIDQSPQMIKIAQDKNLPACIFKHGDIRTFNLNQTFDAVLLMFNVIGYFLDENSLVALFSAARRHLTKGGILIFDFWYAPAVRENPPTENTREEMQAGLNVYRNATGKIDLKQNWVLIDCNLGRGPTTTMETHTVRYFDLDELQSLMSQSHFASINFSTLNNIFEVPNVNNWGAISWSKAI